MAGVLLSPGIAAEPAAQHLGCYDLPPRLPLDPGILAANLAALAAVDSPLAAETGDAEPDPDWQPVRALDGFPTFLRLPTPASAGPQWHSGTAAPRTRAEATLSSYAWKGANPALPEPGTGAELTLLLERLPAHAAVFVFVDDVAGLRLALQVLDLAVAIRTHRCIFVPPMQPAQFLRSLVAAHPGLLPPGQILRMCGPSPARIDDIHRACEAVLRETSEQRAARLAAATGRARRPPAAALTRLAVVDFAPRCDPAGAALVAAADSLGWAAYLSRNDSPLYVHVLHHVEQLAEFAPDCAILSGPAAGSIAAAIPGRVCQWWRDLDELPTSAPRTLPALAASPEIRRALRRAGFADADILDFFWATGAAPADADAESFRSALQAADPAAAPVWLLTPPGDASPEAHGIDQPMHCQLWEQTRAAIAANWTAASASDAHRMLAAAEKRVGAALSDPDIRATFLRAVERALIPATIAERISRALQDEGITPQATAEGEPRWTLDASTTRTTDGRSARPAGSVRAATRPSALVVSWRRDPLAPPLLDAVATGIPVLIYAPDAARLSRALGSVLIPEQHLTLFASPKELRAAVRAAQGRDPAVLRRCARAREHVCQRHTWPRRLATLASALRNLPASGSRSSSGPFSP